MTKQEDVPNDLGLLFEAVLLETTPRTDRVIVAAEGVPLQQQIVPAPLLRLPHVRHFMDEKIDVGLAPREIVGPKPALWVEVQIPRRRHHIIDRLQGPPPALDQLDLRIVDRRAEDGTAERDFARG